MFNVQKISKYIISLWTMNTKKIKSSYELCTSKCFGKNDRNRCFVYFEGTHSYLYNISPIYALMCVIRHGLHFHYAVNLFKYFLKRDRYDKLVCYNLFHGKAKYRNRLQTRTVLVHCSVRVKQLILIKIWQSNILK